MADTSDKKDGPTNTNQVEFETNNESGGVVNNINAPAFQPRYHITSQNFVTVRPASSRREFDDKSFVKYIIETQSRYGDMKGSRRRITDDMLRHTPVVMEIWRDGMKTLGCKRTTTDVYVLFPNGLPEEDFIAFTGEPGAGKTVYLKLLQYYFTKQGNFPLLITIKSVDIGENISFAQFVKKNGCSGYPIKASDEESFGTWLYENDRRIIFLLDGLDEATFNVNSNVKSTNPLDRAPVETWIGLLLSRDIMPNSKVILTSRHSTLLSLPITRKPDVVYTLNGFEGESLIHALNIYNEENGAEIADFINKLDENPFIRLPFTIALIALTYKTSSKKIASDITLTQVYKRAFDERAHSVHNRVDDEGGVEDNKRVEKVVDEFMYQLLVDNRLHSITVADVRKHRGLTPQLLENNSFFNISTQRSSHRIDDEDQKMEPGHRTIAEFHAARHMLRGMALEDFKKAVQELFVMKDLDKKMMVRRFLSGLVNDHEHDSGTFKEKTEFVLGKLITNLKSSMSELVESKYDPVSLEYRRGLLFQKHLLNDLAEMPSKKDYIRTLFSAES